VQQVLVDEGVEAEIDDYGPGIGKLKGDSPVAKRIAAALKSGAKVVACENTMKGQKLVYADMLPDIGYVPAGVTELMKKQQQGWAYIRP
jgi:intracellular sulfur oxidation DsrE/DsrF family protein